MNLAFALLVSIFAAANALAADPVAFVGRFVASDGVRPLGRLTIDIIDRRLPDAMERLDAARAQGAICEGASGALIRCRRMLGAEHVPATSLAIIAEKNRGLWVLFSPEVAAPQLVMESEYLKEWVISQNVKWPTGEVVGLRRRLIRDSFVKLVIGQGESKFELVSNDGRTLEKSDRVTVVESRWRWHEDHGAAILEPH